MSRVLAELLKELCAGRLRVVDLMQHLKSKTPLLPLHPSGTTRLRSKPGNYRGTMSAVLPGIGMRSKPANAPASILMLQCTGSPGRTLRTTPWTAFRRRNLLDRHL
jgi:hypothetical protein